MAEVQIQVGTRDRLCCLAIEPPLTAEQFSRLDQAREIDRGLPASTTWTTTQIPGTEIAYSETSFRAFGDSKSHIIRTAEKVAEVLRQSGDNVIVDPEIKDIGRDFFRFLSVPTPKTKII